MRQFTIEDLHRLILAQAADPALLDPWKADGHSIRGKLNLLIDDEAENRIVSMVLGSLTYRNREQVRRLLARLSHYPTTTESELDLVAYWSDIGERYFDFIGTF